MESMYGTQSSENSSNCINVDKFNLELKGSSMLLELLLMPSLTKLKMASASSLVTYPKRFSSAGLEAFFQGLNKVPLVYMHCDCSTLQESAEINAVEFSFEKTWY